LSNEERTTGALFEHLDGVYSASGWNVRIVSQGYSSAGAGAKEKEIGADIGIIIDIASKQARVLKVLWLQAKRTEQLPQDILGLPDLAGQLNRMQTRTDEGYALIYTPQGVHVFSALDTSSQISLNDLLGTAMECVRGDRNPSLLVDTIDRDFVLEVLVSAPP
jgi:hypothetical protein